MAEAKAFITQLLPFLQGKVSDIWYIAARPHDTATNGNHDMNILFSSTQISKVGLDSSVGIGTR